MNQSRSMSTRAVPTDGPAGRAPIARGLAAAGLLLALVFAPPTALLLAVGNPMPDQAVINGRLTDAAVIGMLAAVVWVAWLQLMLAVAVETIAAVRRAPIPGRIPFTGPQQHLARRLVVTVSFLVAGGVAVSLPAAAATPASAATSAAAPVAPCSPPGGALSGRASIALPTPDPALGLIDRQSGARSPAIPAQVRGPLSTPTTAERDGHWYTVEPPREAHHDTLWAIAERHLGDGLRWKEIFELNRGRTQPDGRQLTTPSLIHPGWRLRLPPDAIGLARSSTETSTAGREVETATSPKVAPTTSPKAGATSKTSETTKITETTKAPMSAKTEAQSPDSAEALAATAPAPSPLSAQSGTNAPDRHSANPSTGSAATAHPADGGGVPSRSSVTEAPDQDGDGVPIGTLTLGLSALTCTGLLAELTRRRRRAQRIRQPGQRLRRPTAATARLEGQLRAANAEITVTALRTALHQLAEHCHRTNRPLPDLQMIQLAPAGATLYFATDEPNAPAPFAAAGARTWTLTPSQGPDPDDPAASRLFGTQIEDPVDPYPALVALGVAEGAMVLVNLEAVGTLRIVGTARESEQILQAMTVELGTSELCRSVQLGIAGCPPEIVDALESGRARLTDPAAGHRWLEARQRDSGALFDQAGVPGMLHARAAHVLDDTWAPAVLIDAAPSVGAVSKYQAEIGLATAMAPYRGACLITTRPGTGRTGGEWSLCGNRGSWRLDPPGIEIEPQRLELAHIARLVDLADVVIDDGPVLPDPPPVRLDDDNAASDNPSQPGASFSSNLDALTSAAVTAGPQLGQSTVEAQSANAERRFDDGRDEGPVCDSETGPRVLVLGPVEISGAVEDAPAGRRRRATELITYLALRPGASQHQLDEALWPGVRVSRGTRNPLVSRARAWLGTASDGQPYVAMLGEGQEYRLHPGVSCDWHDFCALARRGLAAGIDGADDLEAALNLVRGRPFLGVNPAAYGWAEADAQDMISAIVNVAHTLAEAALELGDHRRARWAAARGISVEPIAEMLYRDAIRAAHVAGDDQDAARLLEALRRGIGELDPDDDIDEQTFAMTMDTMTGTAKAGAS